MRKRLVVISIDSLQTEDLEFLATQPVFSKILEDGAVVNNVREIYPTLTYPIHTTIVTGVYPEKHGIMHNQKPGIFREKPDWSIMGSDWYWYSEDIKVKTLVDAANEKGMVTTSVLWPVMGGDKPDHNLAEIWPSNRNQSLKDVFSKACSASVMERYYERYIAPLGWEQKPDFDAYSVECAVDMTHDFEPDLLLWHIIGLDHARHEYGVDHKQVTETLVKIDGMIGRILQAYVDAGVYEETSFVLMGDHGQIDVENVMNLNILLCQKGLIQVNLEGEPETYEAYSFSAGFSTHIILERPDDLAVVEKVYHILREIQQEYPQYIERIYTEEEVRREEGLAGEFSFVLEGTTGTIFQNHLTGEIIKKAMDCDYKGYRGMHGHSPSKGKKPPFIAIGPTVKPGVVIENGRMIDVCPTLTRLLDVEIHGMEGTAFDIFEVSDCKRSKIIC